MKSINVEDYEDIGLNADYSYSAYKLDSHTVILDLEECMLDGSILYGLFFSPCGVPREAEPEDERELLRLCTGTFKQCVELYELTVGEEREEQEEQALIGLHYYRLGKNTVIINLQYKDAYGEKIYGLSVRWNNYHRILYRGRYLDCVSIYEQIKAES